MAVQLALPVPISRAQLRRLQVLWRRWAGHLGLSRDADRDLRHYFVQRFTDGRAKTTSALTSVDAAHVIAELEQLTGTAPLENKFAEGTAGKQGFPEQRDVLASGVAWAALWACAQELHMDRADLDLFIRQHYLSKGLRGLADIDSMADLNRVLWGLKAILRRGPRTLGIASPRTTKAA